VGIGVSFGGEHGHDLRVFILASLAVHNIPEGLAVAIVLLTRKVSKATAAIWCVVTSLPQTLMAVLVFMFVRWDWGVRVVSCVGWRLWSYCSRLMRIRI
jgi:ZIP family zinc transporter